MNNRQSAAIELSNLNEEQIQVLLTGKFGDGSLRPNSRARLNPNWNLNYTYATNSIHASYIEYKKSLLGDLCTREVESRINKGYKQNLIYSLHTISCKAITDLACEPLEDSLRRMNELGLALWFYDDGSLHKTKNFYNLNTQKYSEEINRDLFVPFLKDTFDITAIPTIERKKDGREFWYLRVRKFEGAFTVSNILRKYYIPCFDYKLISSETIQKWSKFQEELKSEGIEIKNLSKVHIGKLDRNLITIQDIVRAHR